MTYKCWLCPAIYKGSAALRMHIHNNHPGTIKKGQSVCFKCNTLLSSIHELRRHQWTMHKESFKTLYTTTQSKELSVTQIPNSEPQQITIAELLDKLRDRRNFMVDVVDLVEGLVGAKK